MSPYHQIVYSARQWADEPALATIDGVVTYRALMLAVEASIGALDTLRIADGDIVLLDVRNQFHHIVLMIALGLLGKTSASMQTKAAVDHAGIVPALVLADHDGTDFGPLRRLAVEPAWFATAATTPDYAALLRHPGFATLNTVVRVGFSSGVTGFPKAVALTADAMQRRIQSFWVHQSALPGSARAAAMVGPSVLAFFPALLAVFARGGMVALAAAPTDILHLVRVFRIGMLALAVPQLDAVVAAARGQGPLNTLQSVLCFGARISPRLLAEAKARLCPTIAVSYGSTEAGLIAWGIGDVLLRHDGAAGYVVPEVTLDIVDAAGHSVTPGGSGVIRLRGPELATYLADSPDQHEMFRDGWFYPGDVGRLDADGVVTVEGRTTELMSIGSAIVAPEYVEEVMAKAPGIADVGVFSVRTADGHDEIWAAIVPTANFDQAILVSDLLARLADRAPRRVIAVDRIPRTPMHKVARAALRQAVLDADRAATERPPEARNR